MCATMQTLTLGELMGCPVLPLLVLVDPWVECSCSATIAAYGSPATCDAAAGPTPAPAAGLRTLSLTLRSSVSSVLSKESRRRSRASYLGGGARGE